jgi:hypothetical protein
MRIKEKKMQKRILWGAAALVLLLVFAGCSQPTDFTNWGGSSGNPGSLKADVTYDGLVLLTWTPANDAKGYEVYRYDTVDKTPPKFLAEITQRGTTYYRDFVGEQNQLVDGRNYEYTVVAINNSFNASGMPLKNGSSKTSAKPKIPAEGTAVTANVDVEIEVGGTVLVTFTNQPNLDYSVSYSYGSGELVWVSTGVSATQVGGEDSAGGWLFEPKRYITFPAVGGDNTLSVNYSFAGGGWLGGGTAKTETVSYTLGFGLDDVDNFTPLRFPDFERLTWDPVTGATGYEIYKAQVSGDPTFTPTGSSQINFISDWVKVDNTPPELNGNNEFVAKEALTSATGKYVYAIKAVSDSASSDFSFAYEDVYIITTPQIFARVRDDDHTHVELTWDGTEGATYKLERAVAERLDPNQAFTINNFVLTTGIYEPVGDPVSTPDYVLGWGVVVDDNPEIGFSYVYKLTATEYGFTAAPTLALIYDGVFNTGTHFTITRSTGETKVNGRKIHEVSLTITFTNGNSDADRDRTIVVYRRKASITGSLDASPWIKVYTHEYTKGDGSFDFDDNDGGSSGIPRDPGFKYDYRIEVDPNSVGKGVFNDGVSQIDAVEAYGYGWSLGTDGTILTKNSTALPVSVKIPTSSDPEFDVYPGDVVIARGVLVSGSPDGVTPYSNNLPNIDGLVFTVEFGVDVDVTADPRAPLVVTVEKRVSKDAPITVGDSTTTSYIYVINLTANTGTTPPPYDGHATMVTGEDLSALAYPWDAIEGAPDPTTDKLTF